MELLPRHRALARLHVSDLRGCGCCVLAAARGDLAQPRERLRRCVEPGRDAEVREERLHAFRFGLEHRVRLELANDVRLGAVDEVLHSGDRLELGARTGHGLRVETAHRGADSLPGFLLHRQHGRVPVGRAGEVPCLVAVLAPVLLEPVAELGGALAHRRERVVLRLPRAGRRVRVLPGELSGDLAAGLSLDASQRPAAELREPLPRTPYRAACEPAREPEPAAKGAARERAGTRARQELFGGQSLVAESCLGDCAAGSHEPALDGASHGHGARLREQTLTQRSSCDALAATSERAR